MSIHLYGSSTTYTHPHTHTHTHMHTHTHTQNRAKRPAGKRPPSRRPRGVDPTQSLPTTVTTPPDHPPTSSLITNIEKEISQDTGLFSSQSTASKVSVPVDDLFSSKSIASKDDLFASTSVSKDIFEDDPFATRPSRRTGSSTQPPPPGRPTGSSTQPPPPGRPLTDSLFDQPPEDVFASGQAREATVPDIFAASKEEKKKVDIFADEKLNTARESVDSGRVSVCVCVGG